MGNPQQDPYADLRKRFEDRRQDYLRRLVADQATFAQHPEANGIAKRRGFLKGRGPRPQCTLSDQDGAALANGNYLGCWTDNSCVRADESDIWESDPWDREDVQMAMARLVAFQTAAQQRGALDRRRFVESLPIPAELPKE